MTITPQDRDNAAALLKAKKIGHNPTFLDAFIRLMRGIHTDEEEPTPHAR